MALQFSSTEPLSPVDAAWLRMEEPNNLMQITALFAFDDPPDFEQFKTLIDQRLVQRYRRFRQRVVKPLFSFGRAHWEDDPYFDINAHVRRIALPAPGDADMLREIVSDLVSTPLDFSKPLWQFHIIENYRGGCVFFCRIHHSVGDGISLVHVLLSVTDEEAQSQSFRSPRKAVPRKRWRPREFFVRPRKAVKATWKSLNHLMEESKEILERPEVALELARLGGKQAASLLKLSSRFAWAAPRILLYPPDPENVFKGKLGVTKVGAWSAPLPLAQVKEIGKAMGGTVNDVLLTAMSGALRRYMEARGDAVEGVDIRAVVPVNLRPLETTPKLGNQFGLVFLSLPVGLADPCARLQELRRRMSELKDSPEPLVVYALLGLIGTAPKEVQKLALSIFAARATAVMTNVPGPRERLYIAGKPIRTMMFWVPQAGRLGLGVSIFSYAGEVRLGVLTDAGLVPDPETVVEYFHQEFAEMLQRLPCPCAESAPAPTEPAPA